MAFRVLQTDPLAELKDSHGLKPEIFDRVVQTYGSGFFYRIVGRLSQKLGRVDEQTAEDLLQEVWSSVFRNIDQYDPSLKNPKNWLLTIVDNKCRDYIRRYRPAESIDDDSGEWCLKDSLVDRRARAPSSIIIEEERRKQRTELVARIHHRLGVQRFQQLWRMTVEKESYADVADDTKVTLGTLKSRFARMKTQAKSEFEKTYHEIEE